MHQTIIQALEYNNIVCCCINTYGDKNIIFNINNIKNVNIKNNLLYLHNNYIINSNSNEKHTFYIQDPLILFCYIKLIIEIIIKNYDNFINKLINYYDTILNDVNNNICNEEKYLQIGMLIKHINNIILIFKNNKILNYKLDNNDSTILYLHYENNV